MQQNRGFSFDDGFIRSRLYKTMSEKGHSHSGKRFTKTAWTDPKEGYAIYLTALEYNRVYELLSLDKVIYLNFCCQQQT